MQGWREERVEEEEHVKDRCYISAEIERGEGVWM